MAEMPADAPAVRTLPQVKQPRNPISGKQVEKVLSRSVAVFGLVFGAQSIPFLLGQLNDAYPLYLAIAVPAIFGSLILALVASIIERWVRTAHGVAALIYVVALVTWPFAIVNPATVFTGIHWLYYLLTVGAALAAIAFSTVIATVYLFATPLIYLFSRISESGGSAPLGLAVLETVYAMILGSAVVVIVTMLRQAAASVDAAQATALDRYSHAVRQHATEVERVQVDSIVHDSVLTTFISAARAFTPEAKELAGTMASNAIGHLEAAALSSPDDGSTVRLSRVVDQILDAARSMGTTFDLRVSSVGTRSLPVQAAEAVASAAVQAMVNSLQHAGDDDVARWVAIRAIRPGGIEVVIGDTGHGFAVDSLSTERLGVRVSIVERVASAGGHANIKSAPGEGTIVTIRWPDVASSHSGAPDVSAQAEAAL